MDLFQHTPSLIITSLTYQLALDSAQSSQIIHTWKHGVSRKSKLTSMTPLIPNTTNMSTWHTHTHACMHAYGDQGSTWYDWWGCFIVLDLINIQRRSKVQAGRWSRRFLERNNMHYARSRKSIQFLSMHDWMRNSMQWSHGEKLHVTLKLNTPVCYSMSFSLSLSLSLSHTHTLLQNPKNEPIIEYVKAVHSSVCKCLVAIFFNHHPCLLHQAWHRFYTRAKG